MSELRLFLLGTTHLEYDNTPVKLTRRKVIALLAYLAVTGKQHSRESMATLLWPDLDATSAFAYLRNALWMLKQIPAEAWLEVEQDLIGLRLDETLWVDVARFESNLAVCKGHHHPENEVCAACLPLLKEAVDLYQGDFLAGFTLEDSPDFDEWQFFQSESLRRKLTGALEKLVKWHSQHDEPDAALDYARRWQNFDPLHEGAQRCLMKLYAQLDQRATALHIYESLIRDLRTQGLKPAEETVALYQRIRAGDILPSTSHIEQAKKAVTTPDITQDLPIFSTETVFRNNIPVQSTAFVGRVVELAKLHQLLADPAARLITLTGPGGIGKTRLALRVAEESLNAFPDGVYFVPLAAVDKPDLIISTLADVLGVVVYQQGTAAPSGQMTRASEMALYLRDKQILLVLDNLEQVLSSAVILAEILQQTSAVKLLVTSRERLKLQGEWVLELHGLRCPEEEHTKAAVTYGAVQLFVERVRQVNHDFTPDADELASIMRICRLVQGIPLGLELAAAWTRLLSCREIADEISVSLDFLTMSLRDLPERHQSLRAVFAHSWNLLSREERACYRALSIFRGGFTRAAVADVAGASLPILALLMDKSMLYRAVSGRYEILEVLRQYAEEQLASAPEENELLHDRHSDYYLDLLRRLEPTLKAPGKDVEFGQLAALDVIQQDLENIRAAWRWGVEHKKIEAIHVASFSLGLFCDIRSRFREGLELFGAAIMAFDSPESDVHPELLGLLLGIQGEYLLRLSIPGASEVFQRSLALLDSCLPGPELALINVLSSYGLTLFGSEEKQRRLNDSLNIYQTRDDRWGAALTLAILSENFDLLTSNDRQAAKHHVLQSLHLQQSIGDLWGTAISQTTLGKVNEAQDALLEAQQHYQESLNVRLELKDLNGAAHCIHDLGRIAFKLGELDKARLLYEQSLASLRDIGAPHGIPDALQALAEIAYVEGDRVKAKSLLMEACTTHRMIGELGWLLAFALLRLGNLCLELAEREAARSYIEESLDLFTEIGHEEGCELASAALRAAAA